MPRAPINPTNITPPRVPLIDERTGAISREWYRWLLSLFDQVEANTINIAGGEVGPNPEGDTASLQMALAAAVNDYSTLPAQPDLGPVLAALQAAALVPAPVTDLAALQQDLQDLALAPAPQPYVPSGAQFNNFRTATISTTVTGSDYLVMCDASAGPITVTLPATTAGLGRTLQVKKIDTTLNYVTIAAIGADTIDGASTAVLTTQYEAVTVLAVNGNWVIL